MRALVFSGNGVSGAAGRLRRGASRPSRVTTTSGRQRPVNPERDVYFGDLHIHTMLSMDSYYLFGTRLGPEDAYRFARGEEVMYMGEPIRRRRPLDFMAVTDHGQIIGSGMAMEDPDSALATSEVGRQFRADQRRYLGSPGYQAWRAQTAGEVPGFDIAPVSRSAWTRLIDAANNFYQPGRFTTFIGYEWTTGAPANNADGGPIHRNVIFRGDTAPLPFSSLDSQRPEDLWTYLEEHRSRGIEGLVIPHNGNMSNGVMYDWTDSDGRPIDEAYARRRLLNEPISEIAQMKGQSEVHPALAPNDEFASFELFDMTFDGRRSQPAGSTIRDAYGRGLVIEERAGANPYKMGVIGASDYHSALSEEGEDAVYGSKAFNGVAADFDVPRTHVESMFGPGEPEIPAGGTATGSGGLAGVWAESNTREAIYDALRRKETYATSGTRLRIRFFGGWGYAGDLPEQADWVQAAYAGGAPMGGDLPRTSQGRRRAAVRPAGREGPRRRQPRPGADRQGVARRRRLPGPGVRRRAVGRAYGPSGHRRRTGGRQHPQPVERHLYEHHRGDAACGRVAGPGVRPGDPGGLLSTRARNPHAPLVALRSSQAGTTAPDRPPGDHPGARLVVGHLVRPAGVTLDWPPVGNSWTIPSPACVARAWRCAIGLSVPRP